MMSVETTALVLVLVKIALMLGGIMTAAAYFVLLERRVAAWVQDRHGPNRVGIPLTKIRLMGLGQPLADGLKMIFKEEYIPAQVDRPLYIIAPIVIMTAALAAFAAIPLGSVVPEITQLGIKEPIPLLVATQLDVGMLYVFALSSIAVYGVILGGWSSNSKYSFLGGLRSSAQMIAYELPLGLGILGVVLACHSLRLDAIIQHQADSGVWFVLAQPLGFVVFLVAAFAEAGRLPFDLTECEQELVGGYHTEYGGMKLVLFLTAEFIHMITASFLIVILYLGGWHLWGVTGSGVDVGWVGALLRMAVLMAKTFGLIFFFMLIRWSWPRFRFDQLMSLAWKVMLPLGLLNLVAVAICTELAHPSVAGNWLDSRLGGGGTALFFCVAGWGVAFLGLCAVALTQPMIGDNRPRRNLDLQHVDQQLDFEGRPSAG
ncbi:MAG: NADH-quinone oxidoreductase subunit NuoH [Planctomycetota bacterium]|nr:NADH-quinone oxidoreductase subunit NuoH [Planctomycetota bacterium]MDA1177437.1 NADH-quinone oxidoreductase subunit NuoH [Planctomycetota bacterium]